MAMRSEGPADTRGMPLTVGSRLPAADGYAPWHTDVEVLDRLDRNLIWHAELWRIESCRSEATRWVVSARRVETRRGEVWRGREDAAVAAAAPDDEEDDDDQCEGGDDDRDENHDNEDHGKNKGHGHEPGAGSHDRDVSPVARLASTPPPPPPTSVARPQATITQLQSHAQHSDRSGAGGSALWILQFAEVGVPLATEFSRV